MRRHGVEAGGLSRVVTVTTSPTRPITIDTCPSLTVVGPAGIVAFHLALRTEYSQVPDTSQSFVGWRTVGFGVVTASLDRPEERHRRGPIASRGAIDDAKHPCYTARQRVER